MQRNYPEEILSQIFKDISFTDLLTCHYVCRSWYFSAQAKLLKAVKLNSNRAIEQFVAAFDHKRSPAHLSAVNSLTISLQGSQNEQPKPLDKETVEILLLRFPNLVNVELDVEMIKNFNEELSKKILLCCPNLDRFDISFWYGKDAFFNELVKVRSLLTNMHLMEFTPEDGDPEDIITQFPRMQYILSEGAEIDSIYKLLSILEKLSLVNRLYLNIAEDIENNFGEEYLARQENELMRKRISNITKLTLRASRDISNTLIFVSKFLTDLKFFKVKCNFSRWPINAQEAFCRNTCEMISPVKSYYNAKFKFINFEALANVFPFIMQTMFQNVPTIHKQSNSRVLELMVANHGDLEESDVSQRSNPTVGLSLKSSQLPFSRNIRITVGENCRLIDVAFEFFEALLDEVDVFKFTMKKGYDSPENHIHANSYLHFITRMSSLKKLEFDVPSSYFQERNPFTQQSRPTQVLPHVEEVTFRSTGCRSMQALLNRLGFVLPNLKLLNLEKYCGEQREHAGEFMLDLQNYSAVKLTLDVEPVVVKLLKVKTDFFVLEVDIQENCEERFYKVASDLSSVKLTKHSDLKGLYRSNDYLRVRVIVNCLEQIELYVQLEGMRMGRQSYVIKLDGSE